jgi:hypothetical protein
MSTTRSKQHDIDSVAFDNLVVIGQFPTVALSNVTQNNTVIAGRLWLPTACKIQRVVAAVQSASLAGTCSLNVIVGTGAKSATQYQIVPIPDTDYAGQPVSPGVQAYPPAYGAAGQALFLADQALTITNELATILKPNDSAASGAYAAGTPGSAWDALWGPAGSELTLRLPCSGFTGNVAVTLFGKWYDPTYMKPLLTPYNPATDLP